MDIKSIAKEKGMTLEQVAERMGITKGGLSKAINGNPTIKTLRQVAGVLGVPVAALLMDEGVSDNSQRNATLPKGECNATLPKGECNATLPKGELSTHVCPYCGHELTVRVE